MNKLSFLLLSSLLMLSACGGDSPAPENNANNNPNPTPEVVPEVNNNQQQPLASNPQEGNAVATNSNVSSGLIPSSNPQQRLQQINSGKSDPFRGINAPKVVKINSNTKLPANSLIARENAIVKPNPEVVRNNNRTPAFATANPENNNQLAAVQNPTAESSINGGDNDSTIGSEVGILPSLSPVADAEQILVSGIVDIRGQNVALVKTPWDSTTRRVRVGDVISDETGNINVRVKQISFNTLDLFSLANGSQTFASSLNNPRGQVVLEQNGESVTRGVAEQVDNEAESEE